MKPPMDMDMVMVYARTVLEEAKSGKEMSTGDHAVLSLVHHYTNQMNALARQ